MDRRAFIEFDKVARDHDIARRIEAGETLASVAKDYYITRERVRQIAAKHGLSPTENMLERNEEKRVAATDELLKKSRFFAAYQTSRSQIDAVMGEGFVPCVDTRNKTVTMRGVNSNRRLRLLSPSRTRPNYWGIRITTSDRYLLGTPDGRLFAVKPNAPIGKAIYVPLLGNSIKHTTEKMYVEITQ